MRIHDNYFDTNVVPNYLNKEFLNLVYDCYLHNLKVAPYKMKWVSLDEIEDREPLGWTCIGDKYLEDSEEDHMKLAFDIYINGTYFPIFVLENENGKYQIRDGIHRLHAMRELIRAGFWSKDRKILVSTDSVIDNYVEGDELTFMIPTMVINDFKDNYQQLYKNLNVSDCKTFVDEKQHFALLKTTQKGYLAASCISLLLRNALFDYKKHFGQAIKPRSVINCESDWKEWRGY